MKVKELQKFLSTLPANLEVIMSRDAEGNGYSPLAGWWEDAMYSDDDGYEGQVSPTKEYVDSHPELGYIEEDYPPDDAIPALVLWPTN